MRKRSEVVSPVSAVKAPTPEFKLTVDPVSEQVVLAAAVAGWDDPEVERLVAYLTPEHFLVAQHQAIWRVLREMHLKKLSWDMATFQRVSDGRADAAYLAQLVELRPESAADLQWNVNNVLWDKARASAASGPISALLTSLRDPNESPERVRALARHVAAAFDGHSAMRAHVYDPKDLVHEQISQIRIRLEGRAAFPYGVPGLDRFSDGTRRMLPGAAPGGITLVTGMTGSGKTTFTGHLALGLAKQGRKVVWGCWEVKGGANLEMLACQSLGWSRSRVADPVDQYGKPRLSHEEIVTLEERMHALTAWVTFVKNPFRGAQSGSVARTNDANLDTIEGIIRDTACDVLIADLWRRCLVSARPEDEENALFRQQAMVEETQTHLVLLHQQKFKEVELRQDKRPTREGVKGSGAYVEVADTMLGVHRPAQWKNIPDDQLEVFVLKQRFGKWPLGVAFDWDGERGSIRGGREIDYDQPGESSAGEDMIFKAPKVAGAKRR